MDDESVEELEVSTENRFIRMEYMLMLKINGCTLDKSRVFIV